MLLNNFKQYSWARGLDTQIAGKQLPNVNLATDDSTTALRNISQDAYSVATLISIFNKDLLLPKFNNLATYPDSFLANLRSSIDLLGGSADSQRDKNWIDTVYMYRFQRGFSYVPTDGEYFTLYDAIKQSPLPMPYKDLYSRAVATIPFQKRQCTDLFFQTALYLPNAPAAPSATNRPHYPIPDEQTVANLSGSLDTSFNPPVDPSGSSTSHSDNLAALTIERVDGTYVMKGQIRSNFLDGVTLVGSNIINNATASQFLAHAALTNKLTGSSIIIDASDCAKLASAPGSGVSFMYRALPPIGAPSTSYYGFQIAKVMNFKFVDDYDSIGTNIQTIQFAFEVLDSPVVQTAPRLADYSFRGEAPTIMACADSALRLRFAMTLPNLFKLA